MPLRGIAHPTPGDYAGAYPRRAIDWITLLVIHHTGTGPSRPTLDDVAAYQISAGAQAPFPGFAYLGYVDADGRVSLIWDLETVTWSQGDNSPSEVQGVGIYNWEGAAFCFSGENPTEAQITAYKSIKRALVTTLGRDVVVKGHRQVTGPQDSECPGDAMIARVPDIQTA